MARGSQDALARGIRVRRTTLQATTLYYGMRGSPKGDRAVLSSHYRLSTNQRVCRPVAGKIHINGRTRSAAIAGLFLLGD